MSCRVCVMYSSAVFDVASRSKAFFLGGSSKPGLFGPNGSNVQNTNVSVWIRGF